MLNFKAGKNAPPIEENAPAGDKDGNANTPEEDGNPQSTVKGDAPENNNKPKRGEAYEAFDIRNKPKNSPDPKKWQAKGGTVEELPDGTVSPPINPINSITMNNYWQDQM